jgi:hypothetical protein
MNILLCEIVLIIRLYSGAHLAQHTVAGMAERGVSRQRITSYATSSLGTWVRRLAWHLRRAFSVDRMRG